jgi:hypothetical protein
VQDRADNSPGITSSAGSTSAPEFFDPSRIKFDSKGLAPCIVQEWTTGEVLMLENTRFHPGEEKNDLDLAKKMAALADVYVNDAFGSAHRAHSSTEGVARFLPAVSVVFVVSFVAMLLSPPFGKVLCGKFGMRAIVPTDKR